VVIGNFQIPHYWKISNSLLPKGKEKEKVNIRVLCFFFVQGKLYHQSVLKCCLEDSKVSHIAIGNA
jgi:hypothetical protein